MYDQLILIKSARTLEWLALTNLFRPRFAASLRAAAKGFLTENPSLSNKTLVLP